MELQPFLDGPRCGERGEEAAEIEVWEAGSIDVNVIGALVLHAVLVRYEVIHFGRRGVYVTEEEEVEHQNGVVVQEMLKSDLGQVESYVCIMGYSSNVFDAIDLLDYFLHR